MKKLFTLAIVLGLICVIFLFPWNTAEVNATENQNTNSNKYFISYVVEKDDTLWDIAVKHISPEYESVYEYIDEVMRSNRLETTRIQSGQLLILPCYAEVSH